MFRSSEHAPNALAAALAARRGAGLPVCDLTASNPTAAGLPYDDAAILAAIADARAMRYEPEPLGLVAARETVARLEGTSAGRVMLTASTSEAYVAILRLLCEPGDEILVPAPSYPLFGPLAELAGVRTVAYPLAYDGAWHVDFARTKRTPRARAVFCVTPNNPTGSILTQGELDRLADLGLPVVLDEVFAFYTFRPRRPARTDRALTFRLGGLSKLALLPQMKLAWTVVSGPGADDAMRGLEWIGDAFLSVGAPVQHALGRLLEATAPTREALRARLAANLAHLRARLAGAALTVLDLEAGWTACVRLPATRGEEDWALELLARGAYAHPGHFFDFEDEAYVVLSLLTEPAAFARGVEILAETAAELSQ